MTPSPGNKPIIFYPWHVRDWRDSETRARLSLAERGLYRELLDHCHTEGSLPTDPRVLANIAGCSLKQLRRLFPQVKAEFQEIDGRFVNLKAAQVRERIRKKQAAGAAGAEKRWSSSAENPSGEYFDGDRNGFQTAPDGNHKEPARLVASHAESTKATESANAVAMQSNTNTNRKSNTSSSGDEGLFELGPSKPSLEELQKVWFDHEFWPGYWRKVDRSDALKAFKKHAVTVTLKDKIVAAVKDQFGAYVTREVEHRPHASTWLNKRRYEDDVHASPKAPSPYTIED